MHHEPPSWSHRLSLLIWGLAWGTGCAPDLAAPRTHPGAGGGGGPAGSLVVEPAAPIDAAPPVLRLHAHLPAPADEIDPARVLLFQGDLGPAHLRQIERGELSNALSERLVPTLVWIEDDPPDQAVAVVAPTVALTRGERYALAAGQPPASFAIDIAAEGGPPILPRLWPPPEQGATVGLGVWCGDTVLPDLVAEAALSPNGPGGALRRGAVDSVGARCVRFEAPDAPATPEGQLVGPPAFGSEPPLAALDPRPFALEAPPETTEPAACDEGEVPFGPGCAAVADDRIYARSAEAPLLWAIAGEGLDKVVATRPGDPFLVWPLPPLSSIALQVTTTDTAGAADRRAFSASTLAPMPHVLINEVLANPLGPEPAQEWVELYNDGSVTADLGGYKLADVGGVISLPPAPLAPGAFALIVNETFLDDDGLDPPPPPDALVLRVPKLGKDGLSNAGEPLQLRDASGTLLSRSPASPKPKAGMSISRTSPHAPDGLAASYATSWPTPGRENILGKDEP